MSDKTYLIHVHIANRPGQCFWLARPLGWARLVDEIERADELTLAEAAHECNLLANVFDCQIDYWWTAPDLAELPSNISKLIGLPC